MMISFTNQLSPDPPDTGLPQTTQTGPKEPHSSCLRVLHVIPGEAGGSSMIFAKREAQQLERAGVIPRLFFLQSRMSPIGLASEWRRFRREVREFRPDLVHAQYGTVTACMAAFGAMVPAVVTFRGSDLNRDPSVSLVRYLMSYSLSQIAALKAIRLVCQCRQLRSRLWWRRERVTVLPGSVDLERFHSMSQEKARNALGWPNDERVVLFNAGTFVRKVKRLDLAKAAITEAQKSIEKVRLVILDGSVSPDEIPIYLNAADCLLVTSDSEGSPAIVREAMACNLPVVSVDVGDIAERLCDVAESRITSRDPGELGAAVAKFLVTRTRSNGRRYARDFSVDCFNQQLVSVYESALAARGRRRHRS